MLRFWAGFILLFIIVFGLLAVCAAFLFTGSPFKALGMLVVVFVLQRVIPKPIAWLTMIGAKHGS